ncbi:formate--tetrahydrofolate ligase [Persicobacter psychrovividus]|uniref:Formate--tetrahydrofolate ligase n=1 Tax=Persicobacter psychrovividus TaxID=387638 RepID=A0ABN6L9M6_9BACT|nr:formate--tetrahydrofolate ligase [Persicobacter psychrovividus]
MKTDIQIAREAHLAPIQEIAEKVNIPTEDLYPFGKHIAKVPHTLVDDEKVQKSNLILVTAITPTKSGNGKTLTSIGLTLGLNKLGKKAIVALREPSLGPCFGMKGGAAGGGYAQVVPMEKINLHFTGDFHAITSAHNMISALLDNYQHQNKFTGKLLKEVVWKRVLDVNDRNLRQMVSGVGGNANGITSETGFDITPASEIMAIMCLANDLTDLRIRIENILLGYTADNKAFTVKDLGVAGAIVALLKDAIDPNLVQTTENTPAFVHGGPFANIAHGCNSVLATKLAMTFGEYAVTEAGFGADLGAEKFFNIKCKHAGIAPKATVIVATCPALKMHGGIAEDALKEENLSGVEAGLKNLAKHVENMQNFGQPVVIAMNRFPWDTEAELAIVEQWAKAQGVRFALMTAFNDGGEGGLELAKEVVAAVEENQATLKFSYGENDAVVTKLENIVKNIYGGTGVVLEGRAPLMLRRIKRLGLEHLPVCMAKTQYSFSDNAKAYGVAKDFKITIDDLIINTGAGFIVAKAGAIMRMPGLPKIPAANNIDVIDGQIEGLS